MRAVVQRVQNASVTVDGLVISAINAGIVAWVGFGAQDTSKDINYMVNTLLTSRFFHSERSSQRWARSVMDCAAEVLLLSQISLYSTMYMEKPYFYQAMNARRSKPFYERFLAALRRRYQPDRIREGRFGAGYSVSTTSKGPIFVLESFNQPLNVFAGPVGPPPPYPHHQPPAYNAPPPYPHHQPPYPAPAPAHYPGLPYAAPPNSTYNALLPLHPYPDYNYPAY